MITKAKANHKCRVIMSFPSVRGGEKSRETIVTGCFLRGKDPGYRSAEPQPQNSGE